MTTPYSSGSTRAQGTVRVTKVAFGTATVTGRGPDVPPDLSGRFYPRPGLYPRAGLYPRGA